MLGNTGRTGRIETERISLGQSKIAFSPVGLSLVVIGLNLAVHRVLFPDFTDETLVSSLLWGCETIINSMPNGWLRY